MEVNQKSLLVIAEELRGRVGKFIDILRKSRLAHRYTKPLLLPDIIVPSAATALVDDIR